MLSRALIRPKEGVRQRATGVVLLSELCCFVEAQEIARKDGRGWYRSKSRMIARLEGVARRTATADGPVKSARIKKKRFLACDVKTEEDFDVERSGRQVDDASAQLDEVVEKVRKLNDEVEVRHEICR